jgi:hypothetical protein
MIFLCTVAFRWVAALLCAWWRSVNTILQHVCSHLHAVLGGHYMHAMEALAICK